MNTTTETTETETAEQRAIIRLRESRDRRTRELFARGEEAGARYVLEESTEYAELERLHDADSSAVCGLHDLVMILCGDDDGNKSDTESWLRDRHGSDIDEDDWINGFVQGALAKYGQLRTQL